MTGSQDADEAALTEAVHTVRNIGAKLDKYGRSYHLAYDAADRIKALMRDLDMAVPSDEARP